MSGSGASNLGYGNTYPFSNVNPHHANVYNSHYSGGFGSNEIPGMPPGPLPGLAGAKSGVDAAAGIVPGICLFKGGAKKIKSKIKNITKYYKRMKAGSKRISKLKSKIRSRKTINHATKRRRNRRSRSRSRSRSSRRSRSRQQYGGYSQYGNNQPNTPVYQVAGINLPANQSALANPPIITAGSNCVNCVDNYNHYTNTGFPSRGN